MAWAPAKLTDDLRVLGVEAGDVLMVHASLRTIGSVSGGAAGIVDALEAAVGRRGTLVMNIGARDEYDWINERPEGERVALLAPAPAFDPALTPADPDVGVLAEVFRKLPGTVVNDHPDARFGARGHLAHRLLAEPLPWDDYYGPGSVLDRFRGIGGKVLRLGADPDTVTLLHLAEYLAELPRKRRVVHHHKVLGPRGSPTIKTVSSLDDRNGILDWSGDDYFAVILRDYLTLGHARQAEVGAAPSELIDAVDIIEYATAWMRSNLRWGALS